MVNCDDDRSEDSVMALSDLSTIHQKQIRRAEAILVRASEAWDAGDRENFYLNLALASNLVDAVLGVIEAPRDKPRNESPNGPLPVREKRVH